MSIRSLCVAAAAMLAAVIITNPARASVIYLMTGDSRIEGNGSAHGAGVRGYFQNFLLDSRNTDFNFVGTRQTRGGQQPWLNTPVTPDDHNLPAGDPAPGGVLLDPHHEGYGGRRAQQLRDIFRGMNTGAVDSALAQLTADPGQWNIVFVDIGTNDLNIGNSENNVRSEVFANGGLTGLLDEIFFADAADYRNGILASEGDMTRRPGNTHVVIHSIYPAPVFDAAREQNRQDYNNLLAAEIATYSGNKGVPVSLLNLENVVSTATDYANGLELNDIGYEKVAYAMFNHVADQGLPLPEPASLVLLCLAATAILPRRRRDR